MINLGDKNWGVKDSGLLAYKQAGSKYFNKDFDFTRASNGTYVDKDGVLQTAELYNLLPYSQDFSQWTKYELSINLTDQTSPNKEQNAYEIIESDSNDVHILRYSYIFQSTQTYTSSAFIKANTRDKAIVAFGGATLGFPSFDYRSGLFNLSNGTIEREPTNGSATIEDYGNGWYRCSITITPLITQSANFDIYLANENGNHIYQGDGVSGVYIYGAQLVKGTEPLDYQYTNGRVGIPRIDFSDGVGALLLEPQRTNLFTYSESYTDYYVNRADKIDLGTPYFFSSGSIAKFTANSAQAYFGKVLFCTSGTTYTVSAYFDITEGIYCGIGEDSTRSIFNILTGDLISPTNLLSATCNSEQFGESNYYRVSFTFTALNNGNHFFVIGTSDGTISTTNESVAAGYFQREDNATYATSYIKTEGSAVTRIADVANNCGSEQDFNSEEGVLYAEIQGLVNDNSVRELSLGSGSSTDRIEIRYGTASNRIEMVVRAGGVVTANLYDNSYDILDYNKIALKYKENDFALWINGAEVANDTSGIVPVGLNSLQFNDGISATSLPFYGKVRSLKYFPTRLTQRTIKELTGGVWSEYLLDNYSTAAAAYSLRQLSSNTTNVVRVRRDSDNAERDFTAAELTDGTLTSWVNSETDLLPLEIAEAAAAYSLRNLKSDYSGSVVRVRRSSDNAEANFTASEVADGTLENWVNTEVVQYESDFTSGTDGFVIGNTINTAPESISGVNNAIKVELTNGNVGHQITKPFTFNSNFTYTISFDYYIPSSNSEVATIGLVPTLQSFGGTDEWISVTTSEFTSSETFLRFRAGSAYYPLIDADGDVFYIKNIRVTQTTANGFVTTWYDQAGSNNATQGTASSQPKIVDAGSLITENGKAAVSFDGVNDYIPISDFDYGLTDKLALSGVFQVNNNGAVKALISQYDFGLNQRSWVYGFSSSEAPFNNYSTNGTFTAATAQGNIFTPISTNQKVIFSQIDTSLSVNNRVKIWIDGTTNTLTSTTNDVTGNLHNSTGDLSIGSVLNNNVGADLFYGKIQEIILYPSDQSTNRTKIENNISTYYDIYDTSANGYVATWYDQSVNGNNATQATASSQPQIVSNGVIITENGKPSLKSLDGTTGLNISYTGSANFYSFAIGKVPLSTGGILYSGDSASKYILVSSQGSFTDISVNAGTPVYYKNGDAITLTTRDQVYNEFINQSLITIEANTSIWTALELGYSGGSAYGMYNLQEVVIYNSDQTDNKSDIENEINNYYTIYAGSPISGLLYYHPNSAAAYSVRQLTIYDNDYKETLVKVRRSSDNAEVDVKADTNYEISLNSFTSAEMSLGDWIGSDDGYVVTWYDQSGNDNDATQSMASSQPQLISGGVVNLENGKAAINFNSTRLFLPDATYLNNQTDFYISAVTKATISGGAAPTIYASYTDSGYKVALAYDAAISERFEVGGRRTSADSYTRVVDNTDALNEQSLVTGYLDYANGDAYIWRNNSVGVINNSFLVGQMDNSTSVISDNIGGATSVQQYMGNIQEIIIYTSDQSANRTGIETNINNYFNIY